MIIDGLNIQLPIHHCSIPPQGPKFISDHLLHVLSHFRVGKLTRLLQGLSVNLNYFSAHHEEFEIHLGIQWYQSSSLRCRVYELRITKPPPELCYVHLFKITLIPRD